MTLHQMGEAASKVLETLPNKQKLREVLSARNVPIDPDSEIGKKLAQYEAARGHLSFLSLAAEGIVVMGFGLMPDHDLVRLTVDEVALVARVALDDVRTYGN